MKDSTRSSWITIRAGHDGPDSALHQRMAHLLRGGMAALILVMGWLGSAQAEQVVEQVSGRGHQHLQPLTL